MKQKHKMTVIVQDEDNYPQIIIFMSPCPLFFCSVVSFVHASLTLGRNQAAFSPFSSAVIRPSGNWEILFSTINSYFIMLHSSGINPSRNAPKSRRGHSWIVDCSLKKSALKHTLNTSSVKVKHRRKSTSRIQCQLKISFYSKENPNKIIIIHEKWLF